MTLAMCPRCWCREREEYQLGQQVLVRCRRCGYVFEVVWVMATAD